MSMKKLSKKMLAVVAAGAMTMGLAMPVFADAETTNNAKEAYIKKTYNTEVEKPMEFNFTATQVKTGDYIVTKDLTCNIPSIKFETSDFASKAGTYTKLSQAITFGDLKEAGKYEYTVTESATTDPVVAGEHEKLIMSKAEYTMDVYVVEKTGGKLEIDKILVNKKIDDEGNGTTGKVDIGGNVDSNGFNFTNTYAQEAGTGTDPVNPGTDPDVDYDNNGSLKVSKTIDAQGETSIPTDSFSFTAKFVFPKGTDATTLGAKAGTDDLTLGADGTYTFSLTHGQNMKFTGLPVGTKITVTEAGAANYKGSAKVFLNGVEQPVVTATKYHEDLTLVNGDNGDKLGQKKNTVEVTNTYNHVPTTGIIMNTLPYVLMIALCGAALFGFVAFKRRR